MIRNTLERLAVLGRRHVHMHLLLDRLQAGAILLLLGSNLGRFQRALIDRFAVQQPGQVGDGQPVTGDAARLQQLVRPQAPIDEGSRFGDLQLGWAGRYTLPQLDRRLKLLAIDSDDADELADPFVRERGQPDATFAARKVPNALDAAR